MDSKCMHHEYRKSLYSLYMASIDIINRHIPNESRNKINNSLLDANQEFKVAINNSNLPEHIVDTSDWQEYCKNCGEVIK
ncbi:hypothetical protein LCGC14_1974290 [marine sediment metagenome]|uniref:Uncharacterized protein n=1 Tax=marine sediment metagenome TaxID=412755 RepID=A0A0F9I7Y2_9ZZZZ